MVKKLQKSDDTPRNAGAHLSGTVKESAQQIWLAGLGAFAKAQEEGGKVFEALVKEGMSLQRKTQSAAEEKISEATSRMASMANDIGSRAAGGWDKLENIFEGRVSKALARLGVPSAKDLEALAARLDKLEKAAQKASPRAGGSAPSPVPSAKRARTAEEKAARQAGGEKAAPAEKPAKPRTSRAPARKSSAA